MRYRMLAVVVLLSTGPVLAHSSEPTVAELKSLLEQKEQELVQARIDLASAQAMLAKAEGNMELAASEWRKVLAHRESQLKSYQELIARGRVCYPDSRELEGSVVIARVWLAEVENKPDIVLVELPKVVTYYEGQIRRVETFRFRNAISDREARDTLKELGDELRVAKDRLASLRARR